jgi:hypothetical protein
MHTLRVLDHRLEFRGGAGVGKDKKNVALGYHAEIAMSRLRRMNEKGRRPSRGQSCGDLASYVPRLTHSADDDTLLGPYEQLNSRRELVINALGKFKESPTLDLNDLSCDA